jgi:NAD(P)-dependent dehydrogenase (short-subunit alcohol dehydrogenase family)
MNMRDLQGRVAVITGAASGIGRGIAHALAAEGAHIVVADIEAGPARAVAGELGAQGIRAVPVEVDVADPSSLERLAEQAYAEFGAVHILCNNAGVFIGGPLAETSSEEWAWLIAVNLMGVVNGVRAFLPRMRAQGGEAHIVNTGSISGLYPTPNQGAYTATKYAVVGYSERLHDELAADGIGVSVLCPSGVRTRITDSRRNRHPAYGGPVSAPPRSTPAPARPSVMDPLDVGRLVVQGIKENRLYIHTHLNVKDWIDNRFRHILADFAPLEESAKEI